MPYMPTNFYPKNCAIEVNVATNDRFTFSADLDEYDNIYEAEINIYNYYTKDSAGKILICKNDRKNWGDDKVVIDSKYATVIQVYDVIFDEYSNSHWYRQAIFGTNEIKFPVTGGKQLLVDIPNSLQDMDNGYFTTSVKLITDENGDIVTSIVAESVEDYKTNTDVLLPAIQANLKYVWTLTILNGTGSRKKDEGLYDTWIADGYILSRGSVSEGSYTKDWYTIPPNTYIRPVSEQGVRKYRKDKDYYFQNQKIYNEATGSAHNFFIEEGEGAYNQSGEANRLGWIATKYTDKDGVEVPAEQGRCVVFNKRIDILDHLSTNILDKKNPEGFVSNTAIIWTQKNGEWVSEKRVVGYTGTPYNQDTFKLKIDIYEFKVVRIFTNCYWYQDEETGQIYFYAGGLDVDANLNLIEMDSTTNKPKLTDDGKLIKRTDFSGPVSIVQYEDPNNDLPLWITKDKYEGSEDSLITIDENEVFLKRNLTNYYLELYRESMKIYLEDLSVFKENDYFQIRANHITSSENYFETVGGLRAIISDYMDEADQAIALRGPARTFTGSFDGDLLWSYWELKKIINNDFGELLGEETVLTTDKDYTQFISFDYYGFQPTMKNEYYQLILYVKDRRNIIVQSDPLNITIDYEIDTLEAKGVTAKWDAEKGGIKLDYSSIMGINGVVKYANGELVELGTPGEDYEFIQLQNINSNMSTQYMSITPEREVMYRGSEDNPVSFNKLNHVTCQFQVSKDHYEGLILDLGDISLSFKRVGLTKDENGTIVGGDCLSLKYKGDLGTFVEQDFCLYSSEKHNSNIIRENDVNNPVYSNNYYFDISEDKSYSFAEDNLFSFYDIFADASIICHLHLTDNKPVLLLQTYNHLNKELINWQFVGNHPVHNSFRYHDIVLVPYIGYKFIHIASNLDENAKDNIDKYILNENGLLKDDIFNYVFDWEGVWDSVTEIQDPENGDWYPDYLHCNTEFYTNFTGTNKDIPSLVVSNQPVNNQELQAFSNVAIYRYCYTGPSQDESAELIQTLLITNIYAPLRKIYDYGVSNRYWYSYVIIPIFKDKDGNLLSDQAISTDRFRVNPDYYDTVLYDTTNDYNEQNLYYLNPYANPNGKWKFELDVSADDITYTNETSVSPGSTHAKVAKTNVLYMQGSLSTKLGEIKNEIQYTRDDPLSINRLKQFLQSSSLKVLRLKNGLYMPVETQIKSSKNQSNLVGNPTDITFDWFQIEDENSLFFYEPALEKGVGFKNVN